VSELRAKNVEKSLGEGKKRETLLGRVDVDRGSALSRKKREEPLGRNEMNRKAQRSKTAREKPDGPSGRESPRRTEFSRSGKVGGALQPKGKRLRKTKRKETLKGPCGPGKERKPCFEQSGEPG